MAEDLRRLHSLIQGLVRRERALLLVQVSGQAWLLLVVLAIAALLVPALRLDRSAGVALLVLLAGVGSWALVFVPLWMRWQQAGDRLRQARLVERQEPELRGRLIAAVGHAAGGAESTSEPLLARMVRRAVQTARGVQPGRVHPANLAALVLAMAFVATVVPPVLGLLLPGGLTQPVAWWLGSGAAGAAVTRTLGVADGPTARLGDLTLRYTYPEYTGLEPREVPNSTGEVYGPPGTRVTVTARSASPVEAAALVAYDEPALDAAVSGDGRTLSGTFTIGVGEGTYRLLTYEQGEAVPSRDFPIRPEADLEPTVLLDAEDDVLEVAVDEGIPVTWMVRDDYGVSRVVLMLDAREQQRLAEPLERAAELGGRLLSIRPRDLGMSQGDSAMLSVAAWDNDAVLGAKMGVSRQLEVVVVGEQGASPQADKLSFELRDVLVDTLAEFLVEDFPPGATDADVAAWGGDVYERYQPFEELARTYLGRVRDPTLSRVMTMVQGSAGELVRFTQVSFTPGSEQPVGPPAVAALTDLHDTALLDLEDGILLLDRYIQSRARKDMLETALSLGLVADDLRYALEDEIDPQGMLSKLDQVERFRDELTESASRLPEDDRLVQFVERRASEMGHLLDEGRQAMAQSNPERARTMLERLAQRAQELAEGVEDRLEQRQQGEQEGEDKVQELIDELNALEEEQRALQNQVQELRQELDAGAAELTEQAFAELDKLTRELVVDGDDWLDGHPEGAVPLHVRMAGEDAVDRASRLRRAVSARDVEGALEAADWAELSWVNVQRRVANEREASRLADKSSQIREKLEELMSSQPQGSQGARQAGATLSQQQQALEERLDEARALGREVVQEMMVQPRGLDEGLEEAGEQMGRAQRTLEQGALMPAEGSQGASAQRIREAREALEEAQEQQQQAGEPGDGSGGKGGEEGGAGREEQGEQLAPFEIPPPEDFEAPADYREALLRGMQGEVPEEYRALKKRYYEELVRQ